MEKKITNQKKKTYIVHSLHQLLSLGSNNLFVEENNKYFSQTYFGLNLVPRIRQKLPNIIYYIDLFRSMNT